MRVWKNTKTLDGLLDELTFTESKKDCQVALLGSKPINLDEFPNLKGIFRAGLGRDNVPEEEAVKKGIKVGFPSKETADIVYEETANFTCFLIFKMMYDNLGTLVPWTKFSRGSLQSKLLLVIGNGNIGRRVVEKMEGFLYVKTYDVVENSECELKVALSLADCVSLHIPNVPENKNFINAEKLALMKNHTVLINTSRGAIVSEDALNNELGKGRIKAAFDVFWQEPYQGKLIEYYPDPFFMTPHVASTCKAFLKGTRGDFQNFLKELQDD